MRKLHILHGSGGIAVPKLPLCRPGIAGLLHEMHAHGVTGRVGGSVFDVGQLAGRIPDGIDDR